MQREMLRSRRQDQIILPLLIQQFAQTQVTWWFNLYGVNSQQGAVAACRTVPCARLPGIGPARQSKVGLYRPAIGEWFPALNNNGKWDGCGAAARNFLIDTTAICRWSGPVEVYSQS
jgi:hypothetical protein